MLFYFDALFVFFPERQNPRVFDPVQKNCQSSDEMSRKKTRTFPSVCAAQFVQLKPSGWTNPTYSGLLRFVNTHFRPALPLSSILTQFEMILFILVSGCLSIACEFTQLLEFSQEEQSEER